MCIRDSDGGVAYTYDRSTTVINNSNFTSNRADYGGVLVALMESDATINSCMFSSNVADTDGGTLYGYTKCKFFVNESFFSKNVETNDGVMQVSGGSSIELHSIGVYVQGHSCVNVEASNFVNNAADNGGVMGVYLRSYVNIMNCNFIGNKANIEGGVMDVSKNSTIAVQTSKFTLNLASFGGVVFAMLQSDLTFKNSCFLNNTAELEGVIKLLQRSAYCHHWKYFQA